MAYFFRLCGVAWTLAFFFDFHSSAPVLASSKSAADSSAAKDSTAIHVIGSLSSPARRIETLFWHDIALYHWLTRINIQQALSSRWQLAVSENFNSTLQQQPDRWKDEQNAQLVLQRTPPEGTSGWLWQIAMISKIFRDDFSQLAVETRNNDFNLSGVQSRLERQLRRNLWVSGQAGYRQENLLGRRDHGPNAKLNVFLAPTLWQNYYHRLDAEAEVNKFPARRNEDLHFSYHGSRQFENATSDSLYLHFTHLRRDNYFADAETLYVDQWSRDRRALENHLDYRISDNWQFSLRTELGQSEVEVARRLLEQPASSNQRRVPGKDVSAFHHTDFDTRHQADVRWRRPNLNNEFSVQYFSQAVDYSNQAASSPLSRRYAGIGYDSNDWYFRLVHRLRWRPGGQDSVYWYGSAVRYAHETGNVANSDNFDRLVFQANLLYSHRFSPAYVLQWEATAYLEHHVYLKSSHSAGNNWRRVFKLQPSCIFALAPGLYLKQSFGVLAQYIAYDFPEPLALGQSNVFRNFFISDSLFVRLSRRTHCVAQYHLRLEERGQLDWARWRQRPWFDRHEHWASVVLEHRPASRWQVTPGLTYLRQHDWTYKLMTTPTTPAGEFVRYRSAGQRIWTPLLAVSYMRSPQAMIIFSARRQIVLLHQGTSSSIDNVHLTVQWSN
ncbi:MAG: hypothetical protein ONB44_21715 [candidate division KSB1 bacterium]|nr:hypothetical protein [candidate division KSB1 bacterium]MDZ7314211.1 hypothetical protein [candidate division KSB1 bacterium]